MAGTKGKSGRRTKAEELGLPALIEDVIGEAGKKALVKKIYDQGRAGSFPHQQLLMHYMFGKPTDKLDITTKGGKVSLNPIDFVRGFKSAEDK
jgi:hypothetical protein